MMHQIKRFILVASVACMVPAVAFASTARMTGLNIPGDYTKDYTGMFTYLSSVNSTGNLIYAETGTALGFAIMDDRGMGAVLPNLFDGRAGVWAIHMRHFNAALGQSWWGGPINGGQQSFDPNALGGNFSESFDLMWGHKLGSMNLGLRLNRVSESFDDGTVTTEGAGNNGRNVIGLGAGLGIDMNENTLIEIGVLGQNRTFDEGDAPADLTDDGGTAFLVAARAWMKRGGNMTLVPVVKLWSIDQSTTTTDGTVSLEDKLSGWQAGAAGNWTIGQDDLFVFGGQLVGNKEEVGTDKFTESLMPNIFMALETHLNPWLTFRCGAQQSVFATYKEETPGVTTKDKHSDFTFMMGTTVKIGSLQMDAALDPAFFNNPFAQLTGATNAMFEGVSPGGGLRAGGGPTNGTVFPQVSLTYTW
jgi:hypothetical protein